MAQKDQTTTAQQPPTNSAITTRRPHNHRSTTTDYHAATVILIGTMPHLKRTKRCENLRAVFSIHRRPVPEPPSISPLTNCLPLSPPPATPPDFLGLGPGISLSDPSHQLYLVRETLRRLRNDCKRYSSRLKEARQGVCDMERMERDLLRKMKKHRTNQRPAGDSTDGIWQCRKEPDSFASRVLQRLGLRKATRISPDNTAYARRAHRDDTTPWPFADSQDFHPGYILEDDDNEIEEAAPSSLTDQRSFQDADSLKFQHCPIELPAPESQQQQQPQRQNYGLLLEANIDNAIRCQTRWTPWVDTGMLTALPPSPSPSPSPTTMLPTIFSESHKWEGQVLCAFSRTSSAASRSSSDLAT